MKILIVEDDENMIKILKMYLLKEGYFVDCVTNGEDAITYLESNYVDLILLDWMMPKKNGIEVCKEIRLMKLPIKILMLTAKITTNDELQGLLIGADDYLRKPFDINILLTRIKKLCNIESLLYYKDIILNTSNHEVIKNNNKLLLTRKEYDLLKCFLTNLNIVLSRDQLLNHVWGFDYIGDKRTVDTHIKRLRKKIGEDSIKTCFGTGYIMEDIHE